MTTPRGMVEVIDKGGWRKVFPLTKSIVHIGSDARNDVAVDSWHGAGLAARHVQLVPSPSGNLGYRLVNLSTSELLLGANGERTIPPRAAIDLSDGDIVRAGELTFIFRNAVSDGAAPLPPVAARPVSPQNAPQNAPPALLPAVTAQVAAVAAPVSSRNPIGLAFELPQTTLAPGQTLDGIISIKNLGEKTGVQFKIEVDGFEAGAYDIGPAPILFPNVEKQVAFRLRHPQQPTPPAGDRRLTIRVTAPGAYPGEAATVSHVIQVATYVKHSMTLEIT